MRRFFHCADSLAFLQCEPDRKLGRRIGAVRPIEPERLGWMQRRLRQKARLLASVLLRRMHQKRMAEIDRAGFAGCERQRTIERRVEAAKLCERQAGFAGWFEQASDVAM